MASFNGSGSSGSKSQGSRAPAPASRTGPAPVAFSPFLMAILEGKPSTPPRPISFKPFGFLKSVDLKSVGLGLKDIPYQFSWELVVFEGSTVCPLTEKNFASTGEIGGNLASQDEAFEFHDGFFDFSEPCSFGLFPEKETVPETGSESYEEVFKDDLGVGLQGDSAEQSLEAGGSSGMDIPPAATESVTPVPQSGEKRKRVKTVARRSRTPRSRPQPRSQTLKTSAPSPPKTAQPTRKSARIAFQSTPRTTKSITPEIEEISSSSEDSSDSSATDSENTLFKQGTPVFSESSAEQAPPKKTILPAIKSSPPTAPPKRKTFTPSLSKSATPKTTSSVPPLKRAKKTPTFPSTKVTHLLKRNIVRGKIVRVQFFEEQGLGVFLQKLRAQNWLDLFTNTQLGCSVPELAEFYDNCAVTKGVVTSKIGTTQVQFDAQTLGTILGVPSLGFDVYVREDKSVLGTARLLELSQRLSQNQGLQTPTSVKKGEMTSLHQLLFMFVIKNIIPRGQGRNRADALDQCLVDLLDKEEPINLPVLMIRHIGRIANTTRAHDLGYGFLLTRVFEHFRIELKRRVAAQVIDEIGSDTLMGCGYTLAEGSVSKQGSRTPRPPVSGRSSVKVEAVLEDNSRLKDELTAVKAALEEEKALSAKRHEDLLALLSSLATKLPPSQP